MKTLKACIISLIAIFILAYITGCLVETSFNAATWQYSLRMGLFITAGAIILCSWLAIILINYLDPR